MKHKSDPCHPVELRALYQELQNKLIIHIMISHIIQNGGYMFLILFLYMIIVNSVVQGHTLTVREFCLGNLLMHNIEPGEPYVLTLKSDLSSDINKLYHKHYKRKCRQEFKTSDSAGHFEISMINMNIPSCFNFSCRCNYFEISVAEHSKRFCGNNEDSFFSKSDKLTIDFYPEYARPFDVTLIFNVKRNSYIITGTPNDIPVPSNIIETPYFPKPYSPNYRAEYILQSNIEDGHVMLLFLDFLISHQSFIEVTGDNCSYCTRFYGDVLRPPAIVSSNELAVKFQSNDQRDMPGFSAEVWFIKSADLLFVPNTDCGGLKNGNDGFIQIQTQEKFRLYDCIWQITPSFVSAKSNLSVFVHLRNIGHKSNLEFRQGRYSKSDIIESMDCETVNCTFLDHETIAPSSDIYIRFRGYLEMCSVVNMSYNTYHLGSCSNNELRCNDGRCIKSSFQCDNIKQCPDGMDEENCPSLNVAEGGVFLHPTVQTEVYDDTIYIFHLFVIIGVIGIVTVLGTVSVLLYNYCKRATSSTQLLPQQTVAGGELSDVQPTSYPVNISGCDNPPSYEEFIKSSDNYPPLHYIRTNQHFIPNVNCMECTTSFCTGARMRHYSADSFNFRCSDDGSSDIFLNVTGENSHAAQPVSSAGCNIEINHNITFKASRNTKKAYSLDSKLDNVNMDACNLRFSIIHPACAHLPNDHPHVQCYTLPSNFKINAFKNSSSEEHKMNAQVSDLSNSQVNLPKDRCFTWSFVPHNESDVVTIVKTRCFSDPYKGISVHCSLY